ncbi:receptor for retinol uptake stra6-like [Haliotis rufescens]|uniref:receptor for retinol uptake stra6-like n=1 Tax=Haliotis rufescens TaxID=6454 RepID=UPI00201ED375|nr:receptor for retinol uptake stra6-like [Haliotis rufescens]XP_046377774.2 receptor for retinol uptake stra6-like [Haliotis rufescens]XP_048246432.1 receptor for retinol uptake stra6-like [Haliotis rufescens]
MSSSFINDIDNLLTFLQSDGNTTQVNRTQCISKVDHFKFYQYTIIPAVLISLAFSMLKTRRRKFLDFLYGRPALVHPMDALTTSASISYVAAFGATIFLIYEVIFEQKFAFRYDGPLALKTLIVIVSMIWYGFVYFPVFASLAVKSIFSYGLGALYVWVITAIEFYKAAECDVRWESRMLAVGRNIPHLLCLVYLSVILPIRFAYALKNKKYFVAEETDLDVPQTLSYIRDSYQGVHVRKLLKKPAPKPPPPETIKDKIKAGLLAAIHGVLYKNEPGFRYSTRILSVLMVGVFLLYVITFEVLGFFITFFDIFIAYADAYFAAYDFKPTGREQFNVHEVQTWVLVGYYLLTALKQSLIVSTVLAVVVGLVMILHMLSSYRTNLLALYRGDHSHIPSRKERSNASLMLGCMRFAGYQVGYIAWGFIIQLTIFFLLCLTISVIVILVRGGVSSWLVNRLLQIWPIVVWTVVLNVLQLLLAKFLFAQGRGNTLYIDNRRFFFIFTYFMFFFNIFLGLVSCLMRIIKAIVLGALFMPRLDHSTLSQRFQFFDPGFAAYVGYMHVENQHTHPVMIVFIRLMLMNLHFRNLGESKSVDLNGSMGAGDEEDSIQGISIQMKGHEADLEAKQEAKRRKYKATFNWAVFYTLINNPQIRVYRKGYIQSRIKAVEEGRRIPVSDLPVVDLSRLDTSSDTDDNSNDKDKTNGIYNVKGERINVKSEAHIV